MILLGDCRTIPDAAIHSFDAMITDPPYSAHVHRSAVSQSAKRGARKREFGFEHLALSLRRFVGRSAAMVRRWSVVYSDVESSTWLRISAEAQGASYIRTIPWVRWSMPQLSGDRPPQGFEHVLIFHGTEPGKKHWNGTGSLVSLQHLAMRGEGRSDRDAHYPRSTHRLGVPADLRHWRNLCGH